MNLTTLLLSLLVSFLLSGDAKYTQIGSLSLFSEQVSPFSISTFDEKTIFSGSEKSFIYNWRTNNSYPILSDIEMTCSLKNVGAGQFPRVFAEKSSKLYYYCPSSKEILLLDAKNGFAIQTRTKIPYLPSFQEVKYYHSNGNVFLLGLTSGQVN